MSNGILSRLPIYAHTGTHTYIYTHCICTHSHTYKIDNRTHTHTCTFFFYIHINIYLHIHAYVYTYVHTCTFTLIRTHMKIHTHTHRATNIRTHIPTCNYRQLYACNHLGIAQTHGQLEICEVNGHRIISTSNMVVRCRRHVIQISCLDLSFATTILFPFMCCRGTRQRDF